MHDGTGQILAETDLLIEKGKIVQIGKHLDAPGAQVIEAAGKCVMPGWIDPLSGWGTAAGRGQARDNDETSDPVTRAGRRRCFLIRRVCCISGCGAMASRRRASRQQ